jgi:deoxycytidine triphosphate deaminase/addiction module HigA family antidote
MSAKFQVAETNIEGSGALSPGEHLRAEIERLGLDQIEVSQATSVSRQSINNIINGRQPISRAMALKLGELTGQSADYWLRSEFSPQSSRWSTSTIVSKERSPGVGILVNDQIVRAVREGVIGVDPFTEANVQLASLDLTLHDFVLTADGRQIDISEGPGFPLKPNHAIMVATREWVSFPRNYLGRVGGMSSLARLGLITSHGFQIDPGFEGNLHFCIFNAGANSFMLRGGEPIISLEIMPLHAVPASDERAAKHLREASNRDKVVSLLRAGTDDCRRLIHDAIRARAKIEPTARGFEAKIAALNVEFNASSAEAALDAAVQGTLAALRALRDRPDMAREEWAKYARFFDEVVTDLDLNSDQVRTVLTGLGLHSEGDDVLVVSLREGDGVVLHLPTGTSSITLRHLAQRLKEDVSHVVLALAGLATPKGDTTRAVS